jgi:hypothetical protein
MNLKLVTGAVVATFALLSANLHAQTLGCSTGGAGGPIPVTGTGGGGTFPTTLPPSPGVFPLAVASLPPGATVVTEVKMLGLTHTYVGDLHFVLTAPSGVQHNLLVRRAGSCDLAGDYTVIPVCTGGTSYPTSCTTTLTPGAYDQFFGTWPDGTNGIFNTPLDTIGAATGSWTLTVYDWAGADIGTLTSWDLCFGTPPTPSAPGSAPTLTSPLDNASVFGPNVDLIWAAVDCATSYQVEVDGVVFPSASTTYAYTSAPGAHSWRVRGRNNVGAGPWSAPRSFTDLGAPPGACNGMELTTLFAQNNGLGTGSIIYFDVNVTNPAGITLSQLDTNVSGTVGAGITLDVYTTPGSYLGNELNSAAWTLVSTGGGVAVGNNLPSVIDVADVFLAPGSYGFGLLITGGGHSYTNGTGSNQAYSNADLALSLGKSQATPWVTTPFDPRVWNGTFRYNCSGTTPTTYCTAGTTTNNCVPAISATAQPSASFANACQIDVANVEGVKQGLIFYGINNTGFTPVPWGAGSTSFFCVKAPTQRTLSQNSGGVAGTCSGALTLDWNQFQSTFPGALGAPFSAGDKVYAQAWFRDPPAPRTTNLSDAVELTVAP